MYFQKDPDVIMWVHHTLIIVGYQIVMVRAFVFYHSIGCQMH